MKHPCLTLCVVAVTILAACHSATDMQADADIYKPANYLNSDGEEMFMTSISRYICPLPKRANDENRFESRFDSAYARLVENYELVLYYEDRTKGTIYFAVKRPAPSLKLKFVATSGKFHPAPDDPLKGYEEVFRTWKMEEPELSNKLTLLFHKMVVGEDLTPFYSANSGGEEYIEFPDAETHYNKEQRRWETSRADLLAPYKKPFEHLQDTLH